MARSTEIDQPRYARWVQISHAMDAIEPGLTVFLQGLGRIDAKLVHEEATYRRLDTELRTSFEESLRLTDRFALSHLWVLGAYEATRTLDQRVRNNASLLTRQLARQLTRVKREFERVRIPLAKFEPSRKHEQTDFSLARPAMHRELGISWRVAKRVFVPRHRLSERLMALLGAIQDYQNRRNRHLTTRSTRTRSVRSAPVSAAR
jgi:hypothetical protein